MAEGLPTTFAVLGETANEAATSVLIPALDAPEPAIRRAALRAILRRRSPTGRRAVVERLDRLDESSRRIVRDHRVRMISALRDALLSRDPHLFANACDAAVGFREYDLIATLVTAVEDPQHPQSRLATETLLALIEHLYDDVTGPRDYRQRRDFQLVRRHVVETLEGAVSRYAQHQRRELCEALLVLAERDNALLLRILSDPHEPSYLAVIDVLTHSNRRGVIGLLLSFIDAPRAPSVILSVVAHRDDVPFVRRLLQLVSPSPSSVVERNLKRIEAIAWLEKESFPIEALTGEEQASLVAVVTVSGIKRQVAFGVIERLLTGGHVEGRRAAAAALAEHHGAAANELCLARLDDPDPVVQARLAEQLRGRGIRGAMGLLLEMVDSPHEQVREAARGQLEEFHIDRFLAAFDMLPDEVRESTGVLVNKVDPGAVPRLAEELASQARSRRLRGIAVVRALRASDALESQLIELLEDEDHMVRTEAARALSECSSRAAAAALRRALSDRSVTVRQAAEESLEAMANPSDRAGAAAPSAEVDDTPWEMLL